MTRHVCEVWAEQGWCPHTRPDLGARLANITDGIDLTDTITAMKNLRDSLASMRRPLMIPVLVASKS